MKNIIKKIIKSEQPVPEAYQWYAQKCANKNLLKQGIADTRFIVLDTETTGLNPKTDRILSVGAVAVRNYAYSPEDTFEAYLKQEHFNNESIAVHEITPGKSAAAEMPEAVMGKFIDYIQDAVIIAHYVDFDFNILSEENKRRLGFALKNKKYDTMWMLKRADTHFANPSLIKSGDLGLDALCERYSIPVKGRHTAIGDAHATAQLFMRLLKKLEHRGIKTLGDLLRR